MNETPRDSLGLSFDMTDVDRLRQWANNLLIYGPDVSHWASVPFLASKLQILAMDLEYAIRDIGVLRAERDAAVRERDRLQVQLTRAESALAVVAVTGISVCLD